MNGTNYDLEHDPERVCPLTPCMSTDQEALAPGAAVRPVWITAESLVSARCHEDSRTSHARRRLRTF
jgi:hypothetical protein